MGANRGRSQGSRAAGGGSPRGGSRASSSRRSGSSRGSGSARSSRTTRGSSRTGSSRTSRAASSRSTRTARGRGGRPAHERLRISVSRSHPALRALGVGLGVLALAALIAGGYDLFRSLTTRRRPMDPDAQVSLALQDPGLTYENPYEWGRLSVGTDGRYHYIVDGQDAGRTGIDVSEHQGAIDWDAVAADGVSFAIVRVGYRGTENGAIGADAYFSANLAGARAAGLDVGAYFYSQAVSVEEAQEEADFVLAQLRGAQLNYPVAFDLEPTSAEATRTRGLTDDEMNAIAHAFCERVEEGGYRAMVYGNKPDLGHLRLEEFSGYGFWYACYDTRPVMDLAFGIWQYSSSGTVDGIRTLVDMDVDLTPVLASYQAAAGAEQDGQPAA
ncbi:MAG: glycoside hydrolase family 25 protein [Olsenella sp.]|jgi:lysozyme